MKKNIILIIFILNTFTSFGQNKNTYFTWDNFLDRFDKEVITAEEIYKRMVAAGLQENSLAKIEFTCTSNKEENLIKLGEYINSHYPYSMKPIRQKNDKWEISGETDELPITANNLLYWALDIYKLAFEHDASLQDYGAPFDAKNQKLPSFDDEKSNTYFEQGLDLYSKGNLSGAFANLSLSISIDPKNPNAYYARGIIKNELYSWKSAINDYDKAIEIAPNFVAALINRGSVRDQNGDYQGAINDYQLVLNIQHLDLKNKQLVLYNLGNTYHNLNNSRKACEYWEQALTFGLKSAKELLKTYCK